MANWNFRVVRKKEANGEITFNIHEVYYDKHGNPEFYSGSPMEPSGGSVQELRTQVIRMLKALDQPILKSEDF
jgi:hypothetical protein